MGRFFFAGGVFGGISTTPYGLPSVAVDFVATPSLMKGNFGFGCSTTNGH